MDNALYQDFIMWQASIKYLAPLCIVDFPGSTLHLFFIFAVRVI